MTLVAKKRKLASRQRSMFLRMIWRAALVRRGRALTALLAVAVAAAVTTTLLNLYVDAQAKLRTEFRKYGVNIVVVAPEGASLPADALSKVESVIGARGMAVPVAYAVAKAGDTPVVVVGTDLAKATRTNSWWKLTLAKDETSTTGVIAGQKAFDALFLKQGHESLRFGPNALDVVPVWILKTGGTEDSRIYFDLPDFTRWTGVQPSTIEIAYNGSASEIDAAIKQLQQALPGNDVRPVRQITEGEARVLGKTRAALLASTALVIALAALCVLATLISGVLDRRRDFALMKALGASEALVKGFFAAEAGLTGAVGAVVGFLVGVGAAVWIGRANFHTPIDPRFSVFPVVFLGGIAIALLAALIPISFLRGIQPAMILRGE